MGFISDLATLVKGGMTFKDIKELYELQETVETSPKQKDAAPEVEDKGGDKKEEVQEKDVNKDDFEELKKLLQD